MSECKVEEKCRRLFGIWTVVGIVVLLIVVILITVWVVAACCGYCTCILCCLKEKFARRKEDHDRDGNANVTTEIPLTEAPLTPEDEERYRMNLALSYPKKEAGYIPPDRRAQLSQFTIESVIGGARGSRI